MLHRIEYCSKLNIVNRCGIRAERIDKMKDLSYKMNENLVQRQSGETLMVYNSVTSEIYELNSVSADIFTYLSENKPLDKLIDSQYETQRNLEKAFAVTQAIIYLNEEDNN